MVEAILGMPDTAHVAVRHTSTLLLGELCEWIEKHPECIPATLEFLLRALQNSVLACVAAYALQVFLIYKYKDKRYNGIKFIFDFFRTYAVLVVVTCTYIYQDFFKLFKVWILSNYQHMQL